MRLFVCKVGTRKFAKYFFGQLVIRPRRSIRSFVASRGVSCLAHAIHLGSPSVPVSVPANTLEARLPDFLNFVCHVLRMCASAQIRFPIVQPISISMVDQHPLFGFHDYSVKVNRRCLAIFDFTSGDIKRVPGLRSALSNTPMVTRCQFGIFGVNDCEHSIRQHDFDRRGRGILRGHFLTPGSHTASRRRCDAPRWLPPFGGFSLPSFYHEGRR